MEPLRFGQLCPVCAGPLVLAEGGAGCVLCGYAIQRRATPRLRATAFRRTVPTVQPRQLALRLIS